MEMTVFVDFFVRKQWALTPPQSANKWKIIIIMLLALPNTQQYQLSLSNYLFTEIDNILIR